ncbi:MAG TPA: hypothetical protein VFA81_04080 [Burkholderiales bacterium]|nr:hypothetical protein [Burkholderiales bacterium]
MSTTPTTNFAFGKPAVGGDSGAWGTELNAFMDALDTDLFSVQSTANAALPKAGGVLTGRLDAKNSTIAAVNGGNLGATLACDPAGTANYYSGVVTQNLTVTVTNPPASVACGLVLVLVNGGAFTITWPASFKWPGGVVPTLSSSGTDMLAFISDSAGATWRMIGIQLNVH